MGASGFRSGFRESFGFRILSSFIAVIVVTLTVYTVISAVREGNKVKENLRAEGELYAGILARSAVLGIFSENTKLLEEAAAGIAAQTNVVGLLLYNADLQLLYSFWKRGIAEKEQPKDSGLSEHPESLLIRDRSEVFEFIVPVMSGAPAADDEAIYFGHADAKTRARVIGYVRILLSKKAYRQEILGLMLRNTLMMLVFIGASVVVVSLAVRRILRPLRNLTATARAFEAGLSVPWLQVQSNDEIGNLAAAFNAMMEARGKAEQSLRESEERYRRLVELSPDAIIVLAGGVFLFLNAAAARLLGAADAAELVGTDGANVLPPEDRERVAERFVQVEREGTPALFLPLRYIRADVTIADAEAAVAPFPVNSGSGVLVIARDVTERKALENRVRSYERELREASEQMSSLELRVEERERHLIAMDLHDFVGQNLVVSQFKLGMLKRGLASSEALQQVEEVRELLDQTIQYTRSLTVELSSPVLIEIGLGAAVQSLAESFSRSYGIAVQVDDDGRPKPVPDEVRYLLFRSIRELLMNIVKHARATKTTVSLTARNGAIRITVQDNGIGFDPLQATAKDRGFGLFAIRERISGIGGICEITSQPGNGATVTLSAPLAPKTRAGKELNDHYPSC